MRAMIDRSPDGIKLHVTAHDGRESRIMDDSEGIIDVAIISGKTGPMIATKPDGSTWVSYEDYIVITADRDRLQAEVERLRTRHDFYKEQADHYSKELEGWRKNYSDLNNDFNAMTARCKATGDTLCCAKDTGIKAINYFKEKIHKCKH